MNINNNFYSSHDCPNSNHNTIFRGKDVVITNQPLVLTNNKVKAMAYISNSRKLSLVNSNIKSYFNENDNKKDNSFATLNTNLKLQIDKNLYYKLMQINNMNLTNTTSVDFNKTYQDIVDLISTEVDKEHNHYQCASCIASIPPIIPPSNEDQLLVCFIIFGCVTILAVSEYIFLKLTGNKNSIKKLFYEGKDKLYNLHLQEIKNSLDITDVSKKDSPLKSIDYYQILIFLLHKSNCDYITLAKVLYVSAISRWMDLVSSLDEFNQTDNNNNTDGFDIHHAKNIVNIIIHAVSSLELDKDLLNYHDNKIDPNEKPNLAEAYNQLLTEYTKTSKLYNSEKKAIQIKIVKELTSGFYITTCYNKAKNTYIKTITASGIIKIGLTPRHPFKYTYYQPISEIEYTTESIDSFFEFLVQIGSDFNFYRLDNSNSTNILNYFKEDINNKKD